jgi:hypothetical protein
MDRICIQLEADPLSVLLVALLVAVLHLNKSNSMSQYTVSNTYHIHTLGWSRVYQRKKTSFVDVL